MPFEVEIEALYRSRYHGFRRALAMMTGSYEAAEDVMQEAFVLALRRSHQYRGEAPLGAWVWSIAVRVALDLRKRPQLPLAEHPAFELITQAELVEPAWDPELVQAIRGLTPRRRLVFFLRYFADMSYEEIASVCEISMGTVAATIAQGRAAVIQSLKAGTAVNAEIR